MKPITIAVLCLALAACSLAGPASPTPDYSGAIITLERTPCFGSCPIYKLTIYGDGRVEYVGTQFVAVAGPRSDTLTAGQVRELFGAFELAGYFKLADEYMAPVTDLPTTITSLTLGGQSKTVSNYGGCMIDMPNKAPQALCDLETKIDTITNSAQWVGQRPN